MINCLVAVEKNQGIGFKGQMPWPHLKGDMSWFRKMTTGHIVIMGSTTWKSIGSKPLPNRINVVLSKTNDYSKKGSADHTFSDPETALAFCNNEYPDKEIFIIGGGKIYQEYFYKINKFYITEIEESYECDTFFNLKYIQNNFTKVTEVAIFTEPIKFKIKIYEQPSSRTSLS